MSANSVASDTGLRIAQRANARQGTASTKTRGNVAGSTRKLYRQKGTVTYVQCDRGNPDTHGLYLIEKFL